MPPVGDPRTQEVRRLPARVALGHEERSALLPPEIRCVVGIDVAKASHLVGALEAPGGAVRLKSTSIPARAAGSAPLMDWLRAWGEASALLIGLESTGRLWEPLYDALGQAGYGVARRESHQTASWAASLGLRATTAGIDARTLARGLLAGWARARAGPDEVGPVFPELVGQLPDHAYLGAPAVLRLLAD